MILYKIKEISLIFVSAIITHPSGYTLYKARAIVVRIIKKGLLEYLDSQEKSVFINIEFY